MFNYMPKQEYVPYFQKLRSPKRQMKRLEIMNRDNATCVHCRSSTETLNVHHIWYESGKDPWDYPDEALQTLCEKCHEMSHRRANEILRLSSRYKETQIQTLHYLSACHPEEPGPFSNSAFMWATDSFYQFMLEYESCCLAEDSEDKGEFDYLAAEEEMEKLIGQVTRHLSSLLEDAVKTAMTKVYDSISSIIIK